MKYFKNLIKGYDNLNIKEITKESLKLEIKSIAYNSKLVKKIIYLLLLKA
ncbi:UDP-N-acetylmuramyl-tripeptide synthetase [Brachyspira pilosicoli P43/6/78]|uniref:UDP-N-acetylmuramyl-tripeptide synthetase n=1 Tax=Brachyspira pilosicoli P43/6/78 TaxID=1042417 RepID=A0A3B6VK27_BRAPL|nr:UDP-N-acetylmuramyl-tripeptide synthetase [Brachyspira pilosicoli]AGA66230.1 UDP-N-acetylmuramyl-tripeptide synthetase [Brachyspira pilosicoli P43/6/78]